jgi:hypothetical protein
MLIGDFNVVLGGHEKCGKRPPPSISCKDFLTLDTSGLWYTWINRRLGYENVALRLDRVVFNDAWLDFWAMCLLVSLLLGTN